MKRMDLPESSTCGQHVKLSMCHFQCHEPLLCGDSDADEMHLTVNPVAALFALCLS